MTCRIEYRIEHAFDLSVSAEQGQAPEIGLAARRESGQVERGREAAFGLAENWERQRKPLGKLALIAGRLPAQPEQPKAETSGLPKEVDEFRRDLAFWVACAKLSCRGTGPNHVSAACGVPAPCS